MPDNAQEAAIPPLKFASSERSPISGQFKDKQQRIIESMHDFRLGIIGLGAQQNQPVSFQQSVSSFARLSSIFLRKLVIGDRNDPRSRLLDSEVCRSAQLSFNRLIKINARRQTLDIRFTITGGEFILTKLQDQTFEPEYSHKIPIKPQQFNFVVEWPLPGMASWTHQPTATKPWRIQESELFDQQRGTIIECDNWLGQQLVMFDNTGIALKEIIRRTTNIEGAHALNPQDSATTSAGNDSSVARDLRLDILSAISVSGLNYNHIVVIETAVYLYRMLAQNDKINHGISDIEIPVFDVVPNSSADVFSTYADWLTFKGTMGISFGDGQEISHRIRATR